ncbi:MAG: putative glycoside hydrolase [Anaerolineae bacterium]
MSFYNTTSTPFSSPGRRRRNLLLAIIAGLLAVLMLLYLLPVPINGQITDATNGQPLSDIAVTLSNGQTATSNANGVFSARASRFGTFTASIDQAAYQPWQGPARFNVLPLTAGTLTASLQPTVLQGAVLNALDKQPVAGVTVSANGQSTTTGEDGRFTLERLPRTGAMVTLAANNFISYTLPLADDWSAAGAQPPQLELYPNGVHGSITDAQTDEPLAGALATLTEQTSTSLANGFYYFPTPASASTISVTLPGYLPATIKVDDAAALGGQQAVDVQLTPTVLTGVITDGKTGAPLANVALTAGDQTATSDAQGVYRFTHLHGADLKLAGTLDGYEASELAIDEAINLLEGQALDLALLPPHLAGQLLNKVTNNPIAGATVKAGSLSATTDEAGRFVLWTTDLPLKVDMSAPGYEAMQAEFTADTDLSVALEPKGIVVQVKDTAGQPVSGARVFSLRSEASTDAQGVALLPLLEAGDVYTITAPNFAVISQVYDGAAQVDWALAPDTVAGKAMDKATGEPVLGALVYVYDRTQCTGIDCRGTEPTLIMDAAADGTFKVTGLPADPQIMLKAPGYSLYFPETLASGDCGAPYCLDAQMEPFEARGFYVPFHFLYDRALMNSRLDVVDQSESLNAIVVDMKSDYGEIAWEPQNAVAREIDIYVKDIMTAQEFLAEAKKRGIYTIARFVTFKDNALAEGKPDWALRLRSEPTTLWRDGENLAWADPYLPQVRQYEIDLAKELAALGFDEIQFDYFRFSGLRDHNIMTYSVESTAENRRETITNFSRDLMTALKPYGVFTSIDVFGSIILNGNEPFIGQNLADMAVGLDYLSPMIYPQVWWPGTFPGCDEPVQCPYKVIYDSQVTVRDIVPLPTRIRPWLQGYPKNYRTSGPAAGYDYAVPEMMIQRQAADDANSDGWLFWSGGGRFPDEIFGPMPSLADLEAQIRARQGGRSGPY